MRADRLEIGRELTVCDTPVKRGYDELLLIGRHCYESACH